MPSTSSQTLKLKSTLRLLIPRLRMAQKKDTSVSITSRREMSVLLAQSREASARIRVENIIQTDICVELMEILELYAELLLARAGLLDSREKNDAGLGVDTGLEEAAASIIYAAPRLPREVRELAIVKGLLVEKFGKEFAIKCSAEGGGGLVPKRVVEKLTVKAPGEELVDAYLKEIARTYGVDWPKAREWDSEEERQREREGEIQISLLEREVERDDQQQAASQDPAPASNKNTTISTKLSAPITPTRNLPNLPSRALSTAQKLTGATPPRDDLSLSPKGARSPISVAPPAPRSDNPSPKVWIPGGIRAGSEARTEQDGDPHYRQGAGVGDGWCGGCGG